MALLTAEDVLNKAFSKTKYREGFDQDEVDDFLDEVAHTISVLIAERDDLQQRLAAAQAGAPAAPPAAEFAPAQPESLLSAATDPTQAGGPEMVAMAQKLQDEYVKAGEEERDRIVEEAQARAAALLTQAESDSASRMDQLAQERASVERKIDDLRRFERDYRARLKTYLENLLGDLDHGTAPTGVDASGPALATMAGLSTALTAAASEEEAVGVGEDTVHMDHEVSAEEPSEDAAETVSEEAAVDEQAAEAVEWPAPAGEPAPVAFSPGTPVEAEETAEPAAFNPYAAVEPESAEEAEEAPAVQDEPVAAESDAPVWSAAMPTFGAVTPAEPEPVAAVEPEPEPSPAAASEPYQPRVFAAPHEEPVTPEPQADSAPEAPLEPQQPAAPARTSLFGAPSVPSTQPDQQAYAPQSFEPASSASAPEPAAEEPAGFPEPPRYEAPAAPVAPMWAPTTSAVPQMPSGEAAEAPAELEEKSEEQPEAPKSDIYDIRSIFGDLRPRDDQS